MAVPVYETDSSTSASGTSVTVTAPTGIADDDILASGASTDHSAAGGSSTTYTFPSGFSDSGAGKLTTAASDVGISLQVQYKLASSESGNYTINQTLNRLMGGSVARISGCDTSDPIDVTASSTGESSEPTVPAITTTVDNCLVLAFVTWDQSKGLVSGPTGWTLGEHLDVSGHDQLIYYQEKATAGTISAEAIDISSGTDWGIVVVAFQEPQAAGNPHYYYAQQ